MTLQKELGIYRRFPSAEYRRLRQQRERAHECGPTEEAWGLLADVYSRWPELEAELDMIESGDPGTVLEGLPQSTSGPIGGI